MLPVMERCRENRQLLNVPYAQEMAGTCLVIVWFTCLCWATSLMAVGMNDFLQICDGGWTTRDGDVKVGFLCVMLPGTLV